MPLPILGAIASGALRVGAQMALRVGARKVASGIASKAGQGVARQVASRSNAAILSRMARATGRARSAKVARAPGFTPNFSTRAEPLNARQAKAAVRAMGLLRPGKVPTRAHRLAGGSSQQGGPGGALAAATDGIVAKFKGIGQFLKLAATPRQTSVAARTADMTMDQRAARLQQSGQMLDRGAVAKQFSTPSPSQSQMVQASESREQQGVDANNASIDQAREKLAGSVKKIALGPLNPLNWMGAALGIQQFTKSLLETNRGFARFNGQIAVSFAQLDRARMVRDFDRARATSGTAAAANRSLGSLEKELAPTRQLITTTKNLAAMGLNKLATGVMKIANAVLPIKSMQATLEEWFGATKTTEKTPWLVGLEEVAKAQMRGPKNIPIDAKGKPGKAW